MLRHTTSSTHAVEHEQILSARRFDVLFAQTMQELEESVLSDVTMQSKAHLKGIRMREIG